ncbi:ribonuclease H2 subunit A [Micractinium conductrix]|uniref:Ribonuclease n=1 Tax=Micractinium conductrix TaxID=554055 RepID=A0A2P6VJ61_9CHLO|nr:ribonuclease H2 subunit A [Micractinium conductrix]|eukprot:PSC74097.1 ribonuclease H2 subunit A [Micractinium conductrix]
MAGEASQEAPEWYKEPCVLGIDEAGRGPVLGPMVYATAFAPISRLKELKAMGFADSKTLSEEKRDRLYEALLKEPGLLGHEADVLSAAVISGKMLSRDRVSLNALAFDSTCKLIDGVLARGVNLAEAYIDALGDTTKHKDRLSQRFPGVMFTVEAKADATYPIVSAASIVAKVTRDRAVKHFVLEEGVESISTHFGSGYPADPDTKKWLEASIDPVFGFPSLVRFSWSTCNPLLDQHGVPVKFECDADDDAVPYGQRTLAFGGSGGGGVQPAGSAPASSGAGRHSYFRARKLHRAQLAF